MLRPRNVVLRIIVTDINKEVDKMRAYTDTVMQMYTTYRLAKSPRGWHVTSPKKSQKQNTTDP